jgi:hypothetical protein
MALCGFLLALLYGGSALAAGYLANITTAYPKLSVSPSAPQVVWSSCNSGGPWPSAYRTCDDGVSQIMNVGFTFNFAGTAYTRWSMSTNGVIFLETNAVGTASTGNNTYTPVSPLPVGTFGAGKPALMPFWADLQKNASVAGPNNVGQPANASFYQYEVVTQPSGAQVLVIQLKNVTYWNSGGLYVNMEIQLWSTGEIVYSYGTLQAMTTSPGLTVGLQAAPVCNNLSNNQSTALSNQSFLFSWNAAAPACGGLPAVNHYEIRHDGAATLCAEPVTVLACSSGTTPCPAGSILSSLITAQVVVTGLTNVTVSPVSFNLSSTNPQQVVNLTWGAGSAGTATLGISSSVKPTTTTCTNAAGTASRACTMTVANTACIPPPHHFEIQGPVSGTNCANQTFTIKAWADAAQTTAYTAAAATGTLTQSGNPASLPSLGAFTIPAGSSTVNITPITFPASGTTTFNTTATPALAGATTCKFGGSASSCAFNVISCAPHHLEIQGLSSGVTCLPNTFTVKAWADAAQTVAYASSAVTGNLTTSGTPTITYLSGNTFSIPSGSSTANISVGVITPGTVVFGATTTTATPAAAATCNFGSPSCTFSANNTGFIFSDPVTDAVKSIGTQTAGTVSGLQYLRSVQTSTSTGACQAALTSPAAVTLGYVCNDPTTCSGGNYLDITPYNGVAAQALQTVAAAGTAVNLYFDATGRAPLTFNYRDVGKITLNANKAAGGSLLSALTGTSNAFVTKPGGFTLTNIIQTALPNTANPGAADASGNRFIKAGESFSASVTAVTSGGVATPNYGKESTAEGVKLTHALVAPAGGGVGVFSSGALSGFSGGVATSTNLTWSEVGIMQLTPSVSDGDYLGVGDVTGTASGNIGRFYPDHFLITPGIAVPACGTFTYFAQDGIDTPFTLTAQNVANGTTTNYTGSFAKLGLTAWSNFSFTATPALPAGTTFAASATAPTGTWGSGTTNVTAKHQISRPTALTGVTNVTVSAKPVDADGVTTAAAVALVTATPLRTGRLRLLNFYGSELLPARVEYRVESWNGTNWITNTADTNCSALVAGNLARPGLGAPTVAYSNGVGSITFPVSGVGNYDIAANLNAAGNDTSCNAAHPAGTAVGNKPWLQFGWCAGGNKDPNARIRLGSPKSPYIYLRERY